MNLNIKIEIKDNSKIEYNGKLIDKDLADLLEEFEEDNKDYFIEKPVVPNIDSKGRDINQNGKPTYIMLLRDEIEYNTYLRSIDNTAFRAEMYSVDKGEWVEARKMWQDYVYDGSLGVDYIYVDDNNIKQFIRSLK